MEVAFILDDMRAATILQQLHYWLQKDGVGKIIDGVKYIYNTFEDWVQTQFKAWSVWKFRKSMGKLRSLGIVKVIRAKAKQWNQTNYYTIDYDRLAEFLSSRSAESTEISEMCYSASQDDKNSHLEMIKSHISYKGTENIIKKETTKPRQSDRSVDARQAQCDRPKTELEEVAAPSFSDSQEKCDFSQGKDKVDSCGQTELNGLKTDLKLNLDDDRKLDEQEIKSAVVEEKVKAKPVEVKIKNEQWRDHLEQLDELGIGENTTIKNAVKSYSTERVEKTIALYLKKKREAGYIANPGGYFMQALKEDWAGKNSKQVLDDSQNPEDKAALFRYWYDLAKELGYCTGMKDVEGERWVCISGTWEKFSDAWERGYNLEYLRKVKKRYSNS